MALLGRIRHPRRRQGRLQVGVRVRGGYQPSTVYATAGQPIRIVFRREETNMSSSSVVFPDFGQSVTLPLHENVAVDLLPTRAGKYGFTCQTGVLIGRLIVLSPADGVISDLPQTGIGDLPDATASRPNDRSRRQQGG